MNELIFSGVYQYISFSDEFVDPTLIILSTLLITLTFRTRDISLINWYPNLDYKLIREHVRLRINISWILAAAKRPWGSFEKYVHPKAAFFHPSPPTLFSIMKEQILNLSEVLLIGLTG